MLYILYPFDGNRTNYKELLMKIKFTPPHHVYRKIGIFLSVGLICISCSNGTTPDTDQTFVTQTSDQDDLRCGAFSMAYYKWLNEGKTYSLDQAADYSIVDSIYSQIKFGNAYSNVAGLDLSTMSSPLQMLRYANTTLGETSAEFYRDSSISEMEGIYTAISNFDSSLLSTYSSKSKTGGIPALVANQYAVVVFSVELTNGTPVALHWILFHRTSSGYEYYDPYFGVAKSATVAQLKGDTTISVNYPGIGNRILRSMNSCLFLP
jgi:hypothetical protein